MLLKIAMIGLEHCEQVIEFQHFIDEIREAKLVTQAVVATAAP